MDATESMHAYLLLVEHMATNDGTLEEILQESFPASNFEEDWTVVVNMQIKEDQEVEDIPIKGKTMTVRPTQAVVFLGEDNAGIIGTGAGEFYDERFNLKDGDLRDEFMNDFKSKFI